MRGASGRTWSNLAPASCCQNASIGSRLLVLRPTSTLGFASSIASILIPRELAMRRRRREWMGLAPIGGIGAQALDLRLRIWCRRQVDADVGRTQHPSEQPRAGGGTEMYEIEMVCAPRRTDRFGRDVVQ